MRPLGTALHAPLNPTPANPGTHAAGVLHTSADVIDQAGAPPSVESRLSAATSSAVQSSRGLSSALSSVRSSSRGPSSTRSFRGFSGGAAGVVTLTPPQVLHRKFVLICFRHRQRNETSRQVDCRFA